MVDLEELFSQSFSSYQTSQHECDSLTIDKWLASSALQKAIRRGNEAEALSCARLLLNVDAQRLWRRLTEALEIVCRHLPDLHRARLRVVDR